MLKGFCLIKGLDSSFVSCVKENSPRKSLADVCRRKFPNWLVVIYIPEQL